MNQSKSTHKAEIVPITLLTHKDADSLSIVSLFCGGHTVVVRTADWEGVEAGAYVVPDTLVPNNEHFSWLFERQGTNYSVTADGYAKKDPEGQYRRITVQRLRGVYSEGLLVPLQGSLAGMKLGQDAGAALGIKRYEPMPDASANGENEKPPPGRFVPHYDVESIKRYVDLFLPGEAVHVSEKIHGANGRFCYREGRFHCGSRTDWKIEDNTILWWRALNAHPEIQDFLKAHQDVVLFGEVYGQVQKGFSYGVPKGKVRIAVFDLFRDGQWVDVHEARELGPELPWVPTVADGVPFDFEALKKSAEGDSLVEGASNIREGVVVRPMKERSSLEIGRLCLKLVGNGYLEGKKSKKKN